MTSEFESVNVPGLYVVGTLMHSRDMGQTNGGVIDGFRYLARALFRMMETKYNSIPWPASNKAVVALPQAADEELDVDDILTWICRRIATASAPWQMYGNVLDAIILHESGTQIKAEYLQDIPLEYLHTVLAARKAKRFFTFTFDFAGCQVVVPKIIWSNLFICAPEPICEREPSC